jgi:4-amino-4-deoxy-L-arabinose transferase-like glycosyltransferase
MILTQPRLSRLEKKCVRLIDEIAARPRLAAAVLVGLFLVACLPGLIALPPVDRTEIVYAQSVRGMLERGDLLDARFLDERFPFRPIGIYWLQMASGALLGPSAWGAIATYRLPSLLGGILAVLGVWRLLRPLLGARGSLIAAALFAVTPIVALQAELAIPEGPLLLAIVVAQLALLRLYCARGGESQTGLALLFWTAQGFAMLLNALAVPILSLSTVSALYVFDRDLAWLKRLQPSWGVPLMLAIAAPWLLVRAHFDNGVPFSSLTFSETLRALGGAQDMKWKAAPLSFTLGLILGFLPGALLLVPALRNLWTNRAAALQRFLFAWIAGYLVYLELISSKPALYTVQAMFPAAAAAVALTLERNGRLELPQLMLRPPAWAVLVGLMVLFAGGLTYAGVYPIPSIVLGAALVVAVLTLAARAAGEKLPALWLTSSVAGFALLLGFTFGLALPSIEQVWPARRIADAIEPLRRCAPGPVGLLGFREPSSVFVLGRDSDAGVEAIAKRMAAREPGIAVVEDRWAPELAQALAQRSVPAPARAGCVTAFNTMRGCPLSFSIYVTGPEPRDPGCRVEERYACPTPLPEPRDGAASSRCR